jgi:hypothetical protein
MSTSRTPLVLTALALATLVLSSCVSFSPRSVHEVEQALLASNPELRFASSTTFGVGALTLDLIDFAFVHDEAFDLSRINRVDLGFYELHEGFDIANLKLPEQLPQTRGCSQREVIVRVREAGEQMLVTACINRERITRLEILMLEPRELVIFNARGDFDALVASLVRSNMNRSVDGGKRG